VEFAVASSRLLLLRLHWGCLPVRLAGDCRVCCGGSRRGSTVSTVVTHAVHRSVIVRDLCVVRVVDDGGVYVGHRGVVPVGISLPPATVKAFPWIAVSIINPAVESDPRSPIAWIPPITVINPAPITRSPKQAWLGRQDPRAGHPVMFFCIGVPRPVTRSPEVTFTRTNGLVVNWQRRWADPNHNRDLSWRKRWRQQKKQAVRKNQRRMFIGGIARIIAVSPFALAALGQQWGLSSKFSLVPGSKSDNTVFPCFGCSTWFEVGRGSHDCFRWSQSTARQ